MKTPTPINLYKALKKVHYDPEAIELDSKISTDRIIINLSTKETNPNSMLFDDANYCIFIYFGVFSASAYVAKGSPEVRRMDSYYPNKYFFYENYKDVDGLAQGISNYFMDKFSLEVM